MHETSILSISVALCPKFLDLFPSVSECSATMLRLVAQAGSEGAEQLVKAMTLMITTSGLFRGQEPEISRFLHGLCRFPEAAGFLDACLCRVSGHGESQYCLSKMELSLYILLPLLGQGCCCLACNSSFTG